MPPHKKFSGKGGPPLDFFVDGMYVRNPLLAYVDETGQGYERYMRRRIGEDRPPGYTSASVFVIIVIKSSLARIALL